MKKFFLVMSLAVVSASAFAQQRVAPEERAKMVMPVQTVLKSADNPVLATNKVAPGRKARIDGNGLYYLKPAGSMYYHYISEDGLYMYYTTELFVPPFQSFKYTNMHWYPTDCTWSFGYSQPTDFTEYADENGDLVLDLEPWTYFPGDDGMGGPYLSYGSDSYVMGYYGRDYYSYVECIPEPAWISHVDNKTGYGFSSSSTSGLLYGTGDYAGTMYCLDAPEDTTQVSGVWTVGSIVQELPAPASPLYVENVTVLGYSDTMDKTMNALSNGAELTMTFYDLETGEIIETLTATGDDYVYYSSGYTSLSSTGGYNFGNLTFRKMEDDPLFGKAEVPFVIDRAVEMVITGFENPDVNIGLMGYDIYECDDEDLSQGYLTFVDPTGVHNPIGMMYYSDCSPAVMFNGFWDKIYAADVIGWYDSLYNMTEVSGYNVIHISDDGKTCYNEVDDMAYDMGGIYCETACTWEDESGSENYTFDVMPDWVTGLKVIEDGWDSYNYYIVAVEAEPLPSGTTSRQAVVHMTGRGYTDSVAITINQGDVYGAGEEAGIHGVAASTARTTDGKVYNLSGQRVGQGTKGILIKDGKKFLSK